jgi:hypothetical protein
MKSEEPESEVDRERENWIAVNLQTNKEQSCAQSPMLEVYWNQQRGGREGQYVTPEALWKGE